jgi:hypothetical protein
MVIGIRICYAFIDFDKDDGDHFHRYRHTITPASLRGFFGNAFIDDVEFHHHVENSFYYSYPLVQYKQVSDKMLVIGIEKYSEIIFNRISKIDSITTGNGKRVKINSVELQTKKFCIRQSDAIYKFQSPWIALNSENFKKFVSGPLPKKSFLENILVGNILSMLKGLGAFIDFQLLVKIENIKPAPVFINKNSFLAFKAMFSANILLPEYFGLGKSVSKGFGILNLHKQNDC